MTEVAQALAVVVDDGAALEDQIVAIPAMADPRIQFRP